MSWVAERARRVREWLTPREGEPSDARKSIRTLVKVSKHGARLLLTNRAPQMAAALAYRTLFSLVPVLVLALVILKAFYGPAEIRQTLEKLFDYMGFNQLSLVGEAPPQGDGEGEGRPAAQPRPQEVSPFVARPAETAVAPPEDAAEGEEVAADGTVQYGPPEELKPARLEERRIEEAKEADAEADAVGEWLQRFVTNAVAKISSINFGLIAIVGVAVFIYAALSLLIQIESAFNVICRAPSGRPLLTRLTVYWTLLTLGSLLIVAGFAVGEAYSRLLEGLPGWAAWASAPLRATSKLAITWLLLVLAYTRMPNARLRLKPAAIGALIGAILWEIAKAALAIFVKNMVVGQQAVYGSLALIPLFLLWVYITWMIILFGLQVAQALQSYHEGAEREERETPRDAIVDPLACIALLREIGAAFERGHCLDADELAARTSLHGAVARRVLGALESAGLLRRVVRAGNDDETEAECYALARPPESIRLREVLAPLAALSPAPLDGDGPLSALRRRQIESVGSVTVKDIIDGRSLRAPATEPAPESETTPARI